MPLPGPRKRGTSDIISKIGQYENIGVKDSKVCNIDFHLLAPNNKNSLQTNRHHCCPFVLDSQILIQIRKEFLKYLIKEEVSISVEHL